MPDSASDFAFVFRRPFDEQVAFFRGKLGNLVPTQSWRDLMREAHDRAFMVAGAAKADLLADLAAAVDRAISDGESLDAFRRRFSEIVQKHGWHGWTGEDSKDGTNWRTRVIYSTNISTSYAAGRLAQLKHFPLWVYRHSGAEHPRLQHKAWDGMTLPADHPFWQTHYPPNGWGCGCRVAGASSRDAAARLGGDPDYDAPPAGWDARDGKGRLPGIDEGWDYMPGGSWKPWDKGGALPDCIGPSVHAEGRICKPLKTTKDGKPANPSWRDHGRPDLRHVPDELRLDAPDILEAAPDRAAAVDVLAAALGVSRANPWRLIKTPVMTVPIAYERLPHMVGKVDDERERYANFILPTLLHPFEVYATRYDDDSIRPRFIGLFKGPRQIMVVVRVNRDGTLLWNYMQSRDKDMNPHRIGNLIWPKA